MEEEGIRYSYEHAADGHSMIVTDARRNHPELPEVSTISYDEVHGGVRNESRITAWKKTQRLRACKYTLWDHCFEMSGLHLEAELPILDGVQVGQVPHRLTHPTTINNVEMREIYE